MVREFAFMHFCVSFLFSFNYFVVSEFLEESIDITGKAHLLAFSRFVCNRIYVNQD
jgi:hypothetical protein